MNPQEFLELVLPRIMDDINGVMEENVHDLSERLNYELPEDVIDEFDNNLIDRIIESLKELKT